MSWSTSTKGPRGAVVEQITDAIIASVSYDPTLKKKGASVADLTGQIIATAAWDVPDDKHVAVNSFGHVDHNGMSSYGLNVSYVDPEPGKQVTEEQFAAAAGLDTVRGE